MHGFQSGIQSQKFSRHPVTCASIASVECRECESSQDADVCRVLEQQIVAEISRQPGQPALQQQVGKSDEIVLLVLVEFLLW